MPLFTRLEMNILVHWVAQTMLSARSAEGAVFEQILDRAGTTAVAEFLDEVRVKSRRMTMRWITVQEVAERMLLHTAQRGKLEAVKFLLEIKAVDVNISSVTKTDALNGATKGNHLECVELLISAGADIHRCDFLVSENVACLKLLLQAGANVNQVDPDGGNTALTNAVHRGCTDSVELLLEDGCDLYNGDFCREAYLFSGSQMDNHVSCMRMVLKAGAKVNRIGLKGLTHLCTAAKEGHTECMHMLLEAGANVKLADSSGNTPLHHAAAQFVSSCVKLLLKAGADVNQANKQGDTALFAATSKEYMTTQSAKLLLQAGANVNHANKQGDTAMLEAASKKNIESAKLLLQAGAEIQKLSSSVLRGLLDCAMNCHDVTCVALL